MVPLISPSPSPIAFSLVGEDWVGSEMREKVVVLSLVGESFFCG